MVGLIVLIQSILRPGLKLKISVNVSFSIFKRFLIPLFLFLNVAIVEVRAEPLARDGWVKIPSAFSTLFGTGTIDGYFYVRQHKGKLQVHLPLAITGKNKFTREYFDNVVTPVMKHLDRRGGRVADRIRQDLPDRKKFNKDWYNSQVDLYISELRRVFAEIDMDIEIDVIRRNYKLSSFEQRLLNGGKIKSSDKVVQEVASSMLYSDVGENYRTKSRMTFAMRVFPDIYHGTGRVPTSDYNPSPNQSVNTFIHEFMHILFMESYEGYLDPYPPLDAVMNGVSSHKIAERMNEPISFSPRERQIIYTLFINELENKGKDSRLAKKLYEAALTDRIAQESRFHPARVHTKDALLELTDRKIPLDRKQWKYFLDQVSKEHRIVLVEIGDKGKVQSIQAISRLHNEMIQYRGNNLTIAGASYFWKDNHQAAFKSGIVEIADCMQ